MSKNPFTLIMETNKFNGTNYNDWLRNLRIVLDFKNQGYVLDKSLPVTLPEGFSPEERLTFEKWHEDNRKVRNIILASMTNEIQKQYDRLEDVPSIMLRMKDVYAVPDRHTRYAAIKVFFGTKMTKGSFIESHGVKMLFLVEKLEDLKAGLNNDTCGAHIGNDLQVLQRSRTLSNDEMILRLGDGKIVAAEAVGSLRLGKMIKKPFVGQSAIANGLLDLVHTDVCGPLSIPARGGFFYFITFTDDHSRYSYVYLMRYKSEAFGRFKEYRLEVDNQTNRKIKAIRSDRGELPPSFWGYALETRAKLLNIAPSKSVPRMPYEIWHGKPASYKYLRVWGSPAYVKRLVGDKLDSRSNSRYDEVLIEESSGEPQHDNTTSFEPTVHTDGVPVLHRSTRESRVLERYGFVGLTSQLDNDLRTYGEAMSDIDSDK
ncbi:UNVERIFIED_CONTAM: hypothetical protein Sradi_7180400 [Sesamum radiatum]|uniref:Integrase catalytic domain-containing protein n=1 Tax=Sesamum radiatum TaxID=300843 RepID=A0AAW2ITR4_SESRA